MNWKTSLTWIAAALAVSAHATDGIWQGTGSPALWSLPANWVDEHIAEDGGSATFNSGGGIATTISNDLPNLVVGDMTFSGVNWTIRSDEPIIFAGDADTTNTLNVTTDNVVNFEFPIGAGNSTLHKTGPGYINISTTNQTFTGRWIVHTNRLELKTGTSLMAEPPTLVPDALTLDGGEIKNNDSSIVFPPTMGITLGPDGGTFGIGWETRYIIQLGSPITGPGQLKIARNNGTILLAHPGNDYAGGTLIGVNSKAGYIAAGPPDANVAYLRLAANGVLPYGPGKGGLHIEGGAGRGLLDTAGSSNQVSALTLANGGVLTNTVPGTGMIVADGVSLAGRFSPGARVIWTGDAPLALNMADGNGGGEIVFPSSATLTETLAPGGADLLLDGATLTLDLPEGQTALTSNSGILRVGANGGTLTLANGGTAITLPGGLTSPADVLLTANVPLIVGSASAIPAYFDADATQHVTFRGRVWINRLPTSWNVDPGTIATLSGSAISELSAFIGMGASVRIGADSTGDLADPLAIGSGNTFWLDTATQTDGHFQNTPDNTLTLDTGVALTGGGTLGFTGTGTATVSGAITGSGHLIKADTGTAILDGANTFIGTVTVSNGTLIATTANALGANGNAVTIAGGHLANAQDANLTITQPVTVNAGGFTVNGGSVTLAGGITLTTGTLDKQGDGELILNAATLNAPSGLNLTGGAVVYVVATGATAELASLRGTGDLILRGGGTLIVSADTAYTGRLVMEDGILLKDDAPAEAPSFWLDASSATSLHFDGTGGIVRWNDARDGGTGTAHPHAWLNRQAPNYSATGVPDPTGTFQTATPPTLMLNALGGKPVVNFGAYKSGSWLEVTPIANTRTIFWVLGSQSGGGLLIGIEGMASARGAGNLENGVAAGDSLWNSQTWNGITFRESQNWINGAPVNGTSQGLSGGYDQITTILPPPSNIVIRALAKEGRLITQVNNNGRSGGQRLAELIVYDRELPEPERLATEAYLKRKWQSGANAPAPALHVTGHGTVSLPPADATLTAPQITGGGTLTKTGDGTLIAETPETFNGTLELAEGTFTADGFAAQLTKDAATENPVPGAAFWVDASVPGTFGKDENNLAYWRDARWDDGTGTDYIVATQRWDIAPTLIPNAVGALPVIDMGPTNTLAGMQWSTEIANARTIFWLIGSQQGGGILLGGGDDDPSMFNRGVDGAPPSTPLYHSTYSHDNVRNGITRIDGIQVNGTATGFSGGYQVISLLTTGDVIAGKFAHDREPPFATTRRHGGQRLGEVIVYTNALSDTEVRAVEAYLMAKWQRPLTRDVPAAITRVNVPAEGEPPTAGTLAVDARQLSVRQLSGSGLLRKTGDATLALNAIGDYSGDLTVEGGSVAMFNGGVPRTPTFWVDASRTETITYDALTKEISKWNDCRDNGMYAEFKVIATKGKGEFPPTLLDNDLNGHPVVDLGEWMSNKHLSWSRPLTGIRTVFWVIGSQEGGGILLSYDRDTGTRHFLRAGVGSPGTEDLNVITKDNYIWSHQYRNEQSMPAIIGGQTRLNGIAVDGMTTGLSGGYDIISLRTTGNTSASSFGNDRRREYRDSTGGQRLAEVIIYEEPLTDDDIRQVETYLHTKWGVATAPGADVFAGPAESQMNLALRNGATFELGGSKQHTLGTIGGIGSVTEGALTVSGLRQIGAEQPGDALTVASSLTLTAPADWMLEAAPSGIAPVIATDTVTFQGGGTLTIANAAALPNGEVLLLQGAPLSGFTPAAWHVVTDDTARNYTLKAVGNAVYLLPSAKGLILILR